MSSINIASTLSNFLRADTGDKTAQMDLRMQVVQANIVRCMRGNATEWRAGVSMAAGLKTRAGKAWQAGFKAIADSVGAPEPQRHAYTGKLTPAVSQAIDDAAEALVVLFSAAFESVMPTQKPEPTQADIDAAAARKAKAEATRKEKALALAAEAGMLDAESHKAAVEQARAKALDAAAMQALQADPAMVINTVVNMLQGGACTSEELVLLRAALAVAVASDSVPTDAAPAKASKATGKASKPAQQAVAA